jgi:flagellar protein FlaG
MTATVTSLGASSDATYGATQQASANPTPASESTSGGLSNPADLRLVIEDDQKAGCFVYKTVNWTTGEVVQQIPREQLLRMREAENYAAGAVVDTSA